MAKKIIITESLQNTIKQNPQIKEVYFDANGRHYFNVHKLREHKDDKDKEGWKLYGEGLESHREKIPGSELWGVRGDNGVSELISKGNPETLIVKTMSRDEIISANAKPEGASLVAQIANMSKDEKSAALKLLSETDDSEETDKDFDLDNE